MDSNSAVNAEATMQNKKWLADVDMPVFLISGGALVLFALLTLYDIDMMSNWVNTSFAASTKLFGAYWQVLLLLTFVIGIFLAVSRTGGVVLGGLKTPEISTFKWISIIMCTLLAGGGVFWAA
ncbi:BCCT family transporter, partial [Reinekea sp.]